MVGLPILHFDRLKEPRIPYAPRLLNEIHPLWDSQTFCDLDPYEYFEKVDAQVFSDEHALPMSTYERMKPALQLATIFLERLRLPLMHILLSDFDPDANVLIHSPGLETDYAKNMEYENTLDFLRRRYVIMHYPVRNHPDLNLSCTELNPIDDVEDPNIPIISAIASEYLQVLEANNWEQLIPEQRQATLFSVAVRLIGEFARTIWLFRKRKELKQYMEVYNRGYPPDPKLDTSSDFSDISSLGQSMEKFLLGGIISFDTDTTQPRHPVKRWMPAFDGHMGIIMSDPSGGTLDGAPNKHLSPWWVRPWSIALLFSAEHWKKGQPEHLELSLQSSETRTPTTIIMREGEGQRPKNAELREIWRRRGINPDAMDVDLVRPFWASTAAEPDAEAENPIYPQGGYSIYNDRGAFLFHPSHAYEFIPRASATQDVDVSSSYSSNPPSRSRVGVPIKSSIGVDPKILKPLTPAQIVKNGQNQLMQMEPCLHNPTYYVPQDPGIEDALAIAGIPTGSPEIKTEDDKQGKHCTFCNKKGHVVEDCYKRKNQNSNSSNSNNNNGNNKNKNNNKNNNKQKNNNGNNNNNNNGNVKTCRNCGKPGHIAKECRSKKSNNDN